MTHNNVATRKLEFKDSGNIHEEDIVCRTEDI